MDKSGFSHILASWLKEPERHLLGNNDRDLKKFKSNLVAALIFYSQEEGDKEPILSTFPKRGTTASKRSGA